MNRIKLTIIGALLALGAITSQAQSTNTPGSNGGTVNFTNAPTQANFFENGMTWATSRYASGYTWGGTNGAPINDLDIATGGSYVNNLQWANYISVTKNISAFYVGGEIDNAGIAGTIEQVGGRCGYTLSNSGDLRIQGGLYGGYKNYSDSNNAKGAVVQPELRFQKLLPGATYLEANLAYPLPLRGHPTDYPEVQVGAGATF